MQGGPPGRPLQLTRYTQGTSFGALGPVRDSCFLKVLRDSYDVLKSTVRPQSLVRLDGILPYVAVDEMQDYETLQWPSTVLA